MDTINQGDKCMKIFKVLVALILIGMLSGCATTAYSHGSYYSYSHHYSPGHNYGAGDLEYNAYYEDLYGHPRTRVPFFHRNHSYHREYYHERRNYYYRQRCYITRITVWNPSYNKYVAVRKRICR